MTPTDWASMGPDHNQPNRACCTPAAHFPIWTCGVPATAGGGPSTALAAAIEEKKSRRGSHLFLILTRAVAWAHERAGRMEIAAIKRGAYVLISTSDGDRAPEVPIVIATRDTRWVYPRTRQSRTAARQGKKSAFVFHARAINPPSSGQDNATRSRRAWLPPSVTRRVSRWRRAPTRIHWGRYVRLAGRGWVRLSDHFGASSPGKELPSGLRACQRRGRVAKANRKVFFKAE